MHFSRPLEAAQQAPGLQVFEDLKEHCNASRLSSELILMESLKAAYPEHVVVRTPKSTCDLIAFAEAGHASASLQTENKDFNASRHWVPSSTMMEDEAGTLADTLSWGCYAYSWHGNDFYVYRHDYFESNGRRVVNFYICYQGGEAEISTGQSLAIDALMTSCGRWTHNLHDEIYVFDGYWQKSKELWKSVSGSSWDAVILDPKMKENLIEDVEGFFDSRDLYRQLAVPWKRGIIFHGEPGNGKTISIKALICALYARQFSIPSLYVKSLQNCNGPQYAVRDIFERARSMAPCLLVFEDLDSLVTEKVRSYFLNEVDGLESNDGILMIGSTNHLSKLDPAISKRPSRFDRKYHFKLPAEEERVQYCEFWRRNVAKSKLVDFPEGASGVLAKLTEGFSFAYLKELFVMTLLSVARGNVGSDSSNCEESPPAKNTPASAANAEMQNNVEVNGEPSSEQNGTQKATRTIPDIEIPEILQENIFLKVARHHVQVLLDDMDNTDESIRTAAKGPGMIPPVLAVTRARFASSPDPSSPYSSDSDDSDMSQEN